MLVVGSKLTNNAKVLACLFQDLSTARSPHRYPAPAVKARVTLTESAMEWVKARAMAMPREALMGSARVKATATVMAVATMMVMAKAELKVKAKDRQRAAQCVAPADSVASAGLTEYSAALLGREVEHSLLHQGSATLLLGRRRPPSYLAGLGRSQKKNVYHAPSQTEQRRLVTKSS